MKLPKFKFAFTGPNLINGIGIAIILYLLLVLVQTVKHNYNLGLQIKSLKGQVAIQQVQTQNLSDQIRYYQSQSYDERQARSQLDLQLPGENVIIIPQSHSTPAPNLGTAITPTTPKKSNFQQWLSFLSGA